MSTADSQLLAAASSISQNIVTEVFGIKMTKEKSMNVARITVVIISVIAVILASNPNSSVFEIVSLRGQALVQHSDLLFSVLYSGRELTSMVLCLVWLPAAL